MGERGKMVCSDLKGLPMPSPCLAHALPMPSSGLNFQPNSLFHQQQIVTLEHDMKRGGKRDSARKGAKLQFRFSACLAVTSAQEGTCENFRERRRKDPVVVPT